MSKNHGDLIIWQKWVDPFLGDDLPDKEHDPYTAEYDEEDEGDTSLDTNTPMISSSKSSIRVIATPMGIIPINENTVSSKLFNFWVGHTNFDITKDLAEVIERTSGIETLDIFTRYRFRIAVGKAFGDSEVMRDINQRVYRALEHDEK
jgi:hypothetical protein